MLSLVTFSGPAGVDIPEGIMNLLNAGITLIQWAVPILLLLFGSLDLGKAVMAGEEKEIKAAQKMLLKRAIAAVAVFLLVAIINMVFKLVVGSEVL